MSSWLEKTVVMGLLCCLGAFWFAIAPASMSSKEASATVAPSSVIEPEQPEASVPAEDKRAQAKKAYETRKAQIERLKQRRRDTPVEGRKRMIIGLEDRPAEREGEGERDRRSLSHFEDIPDLPVAY